MGARRVAAALLALTIGTAPLLATTPARADQVREAQGPMLDTLSVEAAWKETRGAGVTVAVVDSGTDANQPDLKGSVTTGPNMLAEIDRGTKPTREHGTAMAALIAGHGHGPGGGSGVIGMAPQARVLAIRAIAEPEDASYRRYKSESKGAVARGIRYAADHGADVINLSLGKYDEVRDDREAIGYAIKKGVVVVAAAGNDGDRKRRLDKDGFAPYSYPASYPGVIAVAATTPGHERAKFSNRNYSVVVGAPGAEIVYAAPGGRYFADSAGTSQASAIVSGIAALIRAKHPKLPPALVSQALVDSAKNGPSGKYNPELGFGEVNAARALAAANTLTTPAAGLAGKAGGQRFGDGPPPGPVAIIERPAWMRPVIIAIIVLGVGGTVAAVIIAVALARRNPRLPDRHHQALPPAYPYGAGGPGHSF
ncbi:S8 family serine peptidase [Actinomadura rudentiformis]|uniref:S8 family serine peptidase n=1 Tax=Actinomadura rudentiformis TaxID=359158 RepID=A0A6H9YSZ3_9ACTN|nr:S8 family serine peptidase [Actinomadura rudentiformis]KAB2343438.1 S8 family serine peptidase [Actinomadura rudentiformis]